LYSLLPLPHSSIFFHYPILQHYNCQFHNQLRGVKSSLFTVLFRKPSLSASLSDSSLSLLSCSPILFISSLLLCLFVFLNNVFSF
jgi:hypothetical protein